MEKVKIKITKKFFLFNLKHIWIREKNNKNCMILHCINAEMTILSFLHFYSVKLYNFCYCFLENILFLNLADLYIGENKNGQIYIYILNAKIWVRGSVNQK